MKYYAVTEDPNELLHYGRLGMKWGKHIFGDNRPKSAGYKRALGKLRSSTKKTSTQKLIAKRQKQQERFNRAVQKTQNRIAVTENLHNLDQMRAYSRQADRQFKAERKAVRLAEKQDRKYARNDRKMQKFTQLAREGRLRYGKLSDDQVEQVRSRLALEQTARNLGGKEDPKFRVRLKNAWQKGILSGIEQGTAAGMKEVAVAKVQNRLRNKRVLDKSSRNEAKRQKEETRIKNTKSAKEIRQDLKREAYEAEIRSGASFMNRGFGTHLSVKNAARKIQEYSDQDANRKFRLEEAQNTARTKRQNLENEARAERDLENRARTAYEYGFLTSGGNNGGGKGKGNGGGGNNGGGPNGGDEIKRLADYYEQRYITKKTNQQLAADKEQERKDAYYAEINRRVKENQEKNNAYYAEINRRVRENKEKEREAKKKADAQRREQALINALNPNRKPTALSTQRDAINDMARGSTRYGIPNQHVVDQLFPQLSSKRRTHIKG